MSLNSARKEVTTLGANSLTGRHKREHEKQSLLAMGAAPKKAPPVPRRISVGIWKANMASDEHKRERDRAMGLSVQPPIPHNKHHQESRQPDITKAGTGNFRKGVLHFRQSDIRNLRQAARSDDVRTLLSRTKLRHQPKSAMTKHKRK